MKDTFEDIKDAFKEMPILSTLIMLIVFFLLFILVDIIFSNDMPFSGIVIDKHYKSKNTSIGTGIVNTQNGSGVVTTVETDPEKFLIMVKDKQGKIYTADCDATTYYNKSKGDVLFCHHSIGYFSKSIWSTKGDY